MIFGSTSGVTSVSTTLFALVASQAATSTRETAMLFSPMVVGDLGYLVAFFWGLTVLEGAGWRILEGVGGMMMIVAGIAWAAAVLATTPEEGRVLFNILFWSGPVTLAGILFVGSWWASRWKAS